MRRVMRTGSLGLIVTAISLGVSPGLAQNVEQVKPVFEHIIPNAEGKRMVAVVVTYPPGANSPAITMPGRHSSTLTCCQAPFAARLAMSPLKSTTSAKASTRSPARITGSVRMRVTGSLRACWLFLSSIPKTIP